MAELAAGLGLPTRAARITADAMLALGLLEKIDGLITKWTTWAAAWGH